jgi:predicted ferric reductase
MAISQQVRRPVVAPASNESTLPVLVAGGIGLLAALFLIPAWLPGMSAAFTGVEPKAFWYLSRASGFVAFDLLWLSMALGIAITNKLARAWPGGPAAFDLHQHASILGLIFGLMHPLALLGSNYSIAQLFVPFASGSYLPFWVGLGQVGLILSVIVTASFYVRRSIGQRTWRILHYVTFAVYAMVLFHSIVSGTDTGSSWAQATYWGSLVSLGVLVWYRVTSKPSPARAW